MIETRIQDIPLSWEKAKRFILWAGMGIFLQACTESNAPTDSQHHTAVDSATSASADTDSNLSGRLKERIHLDPDLPPQKSAEELSQLDAAHESALAAERMRLVSSRLGKWMEELKDSTDAQGFTIRKALGQAQMSALDSRELLGYYMFHPEEWAQNCAEYSSPAGKIKAISRKLPPDPTGVYWSERQMAALVKDSVAVRKVVLECLAEDKAVSIPMMRAIAELKIVEAIPPLISIYNAQSPKDDLILTTLAEIMERRNFWKWVYSPTCKAMLVDPHVLLPLNQAMIDDLIKYATELSEL